MDTTTATLRILYRKALTGGDPALLQVAFESEVLQKYRDAGHEVKRSDTVGRLRTGSWVLNFGIGPGDETVHASAGDLLRLPEAERQHWAMHAVAAAGLSEAYLRILSHPGSCYDDGNTRDWVGKFP